MVSAISTYATDVIALLSCPTDDKGKNRPSVTTPPQILYEEQSRTLTIKTEEPIVDATITIRDTKGNPIMSQSTPLYGKTKIDLPKDVDEAKHSIELDCEGQTLKGIF